MVIGILMILVCFMQSHFLIYLCSVLLDILEVLGTIVEESVLENRAGITSALSLHFLSLVRQMDFKVVISFMKEKMQGTMIQGDQESPMLISLDLYFTTGWKYFCFI